MVLLDQIVQVLRRPQLRLGGQQAIGFQLTHRAVRRGIAVQSDRPGSIVLAFDRLAKKRLGGRDIALGAQRLWCMDTLTPSREVIVLEAR
jgi:hypothetical protein